MKADLPANEAERLAALHHYQVLDTPPEAAFDDLTLIASQICGAPIALVSLVDKDRQWFKSRVGFASHETSRDTAFCAHAILEPTAVFEISDANADARFYDNPLVCGPTQVRFYAGAPLVTDTGLPLGALCVMDQQPRKLTSEQLAALQALARRVVDQLELRRQTHLLHAREQETAQALALAEKSRLALLNVLEDEKRAGQNLRDSEERFRQLTENIDDAFWMTDTRKNTMLYVSPAFEKIWGRSCASLYRSPELWLECLHVDDRARVRAAMPRQQYVGGYDETYRIVRPDGQIRWIRDHAFPVTNRAGEVYRIAGVAQDITEKRQLETQFQQAQKMEAIGTLAGGIAHDFNNILCGVMGYAELAKYQTRGNPQVQDKIDGILDASKRAASLVTQILAFSRQQEQQRSLVQLRHIIAEPLKLLRATLPSTLTFDVDLEKDVPVVLANPTQIHQVVMNLCTNAWHAMKDRPGRLHVHLETVMVDDVLAAAHTDLHPGEYARLTVTDNGHGMTPATMQRIFEPFFTTKKAGEGTGLGLSVVHGIMRSHEGAVTVYSQPNHGTAFQLYFPAKSGEAIEERESAQPPRGRGQHILFVDDERMLGKLGSMMLRELGYRATICDGPGSAIEYLQNNPDEFDAVITDLTMPDMNGIELAIKLRSIKPSIPIILSTGYANEQTLERMHAVGITELVKKPHNLLTVGSALKRQLEGSAASVAASIASVS